VRSTSAAADVEIARAALERAIGRLAEVIVTYEYTDQSGPAGK
jgi:hypothetical protein